MPPLPTLVFRYVTKLLCQTGGHRAVVRVGFLRHREIYPDA
jgi:hypothetical protein